MRIIVSLFDLTIEIMIDRKVQMMDAGMTMCRSEKTFGILLGGMKADLEKHGKVLRANDIDAQALPESTDEFDLFLDWSTPLRKRYLSLRLEEITEDGDEASRRYAVSLKEGNRNTLLRSVIFLLAAAAVLACGIVGFGNVPRIITVLAGIAAALWIVLQWLKPSAKAQKLVKTLLTDYNSLI